MVLKKQVFLLVLILLLAASFVTYEWTKFFTGVQTADLQPDIYPRLTKWLVCLLCCLLVWLAGDQAWQQQDHRRLGIVFLVILAADTCLGLLGIFTRSRLWQVSGVLLFVVAHTLLIIRNLRGSKKWLTSPNLVRAGVIAVVSAAFPVFVLRPLLGSQTGLLLAGIVYLLSIAASLWAGCTTLGSGVLPRRSAVLLVAGLSCFYACDLTVILAVATATDQAVIPPLLAGQTIYLYRAWDAFAFIMHNLSWVFYTPALLLIALSGYRSGLVCYLQEK